MVTISKRRQNRFEPSPADVELARASSQVLARRLIKEPAENLALRLEDGSGESIRIPASATRLLSDILSEMAAGNAVALTPIEAELTTQQAADLLNVSRPFLIEQLEKGLIPFHKVGSHRRVKSADVLAYKRDIDQKRLVALEELVRLDQEMGFY